MEPAPAHFKPIALEVTYHSIGKFFKVTKIVNSTYYKPGESISLDVMDQICRNPQWTVTMVDYDYLAAVAALIGGAAGLVANKAMLP